MTDQISSTPITDVPHRPADSNHAPQPTPVWSPKGRFGRANFLAWNLLVGLIFIIVMVLILFLTPLDLDSVESQSFILNMLTLNNVLSLIWLIPFFILSIKRLHDRNHSGWLSLLNMVPIVNLVFWFYLILAPGSLSANQYGTKRETATWETVFAWIYLIVLSFAGLGLFFAIVQMLTLLF